MGLGIKSGKSNQNGVPPPKVGLLILNLFSKFPNSKKEDLTTLYAKC